MTYLGTGQFGFSSNTLGPESGNSVSLGTYGVSCGTLAGAVYTVASITTGAGFRVPHGTAPTSPVDGDVWTTTTAMFVRINGSTKTLLVL